MVHEHHKVSSVLLNFVRAEASVILEEYKYRRESGGKFSHETYVMILLSGIFLALLKGSE